MSWTRSERRTPLIEPGPVQHSAPRCTMNDPATLHVEASGDPSAATFTLYNEDHTMGNTLRYMLNKKAEVSFVGYSVPHPAEAKMNLRLQTVGPPATEVLIDALSTVHSVGEHVLKTFESAVADFKQKQQAAQGER